MSDPADKPRGDAGVAKREYGDHSKEDLDRLLEACDRRDKICFGVVGEADELEHDKDLKSDFVALDVALKLSCPAIEVGTAGPGDAWRNLGSRSG